MSTICDNSVTDTTMINTNIAHSGNWYEKLIIDIGNCEKVCPKHSSCTMFQFEQHLLKKYIQLYKIFEQCPCRNCLTATRCASRGTVCFDRVLAFMTYLQVRDNIEKKN